MTQPYYVVSTDSRHQVGVEASGAGSEYKDL